jgi:hypothetical protein
LVVALIPLVWRRSLLPLAIGVVALPVGGVIGRLAWEWFADPPRGTDFGSEFEGYDWVIGFASVSALLGTLVGVVLATRRRRHPGRVLRQTRRRWGLPERAPPPMP